MRPTGARAKPARDFTKPAAQFGGIDPGALHHAAHHLVAEQLVEARLARQSQGHHVRIPFFKTDQHDRDSAGLDWPICGNRWLISRRGGWFGTAFATVAEMR
ncbi:MAG TPA: hypothetical protein VMU87_03640 [Stellaceae bacterium]|nr:hypothetical protein [Stellaceae bacterium]